MVITSGAPYKLLYALIDHGYSLALRVEEGIQIKLQRMCINTEKGKKFFYC